MSDSLWPHEPQHARPHCASPTPRVYTNSCPSSRWCHPAISSSVIPFSCPQSFPASASFPMSQLFASGGQSIGVSASTSVLPMNTQDWSPLGWTGWVSLQSQGLSRVFSNTLAICMHIPTLFWIYSHLGPPPSGSDDKESAGNAGDPGLIPGSGRSPGEGNGYPLQYSCLENPMDGEYGVTESRTQLND